MKHLKALLVLSLIFGISKYCSAQEAWTGARLVTLAGVSSYSSLDGKNWSESVIGWPPSETINWTGTQLVAVGITGQLHTSPDGLKWTEENAWINQGTHSIVWTGSQLVAVGE